MQDKHYHTIDPLILQTLHLNEKRMKRMLDILHGNDYDPPQAIKALKKHKQSMNKYQFLKLHEKVKSPRQIRRQNLEQERAASVSQLYQPKIRQKKYVKNEKYAPNQITQKNKHVAPSISLPKNLLKKYETINTQQASHFEKHTQRSHSLLRKNYGQLKTSRTSRSLDINPKDIYRLQIEALVAKPTQIEDMQDAQQLMRRLKRRYQHLRKFDRGYFSKLNQIDFLLI